MSTMQKNPVFSLEVQAAIPEAEMPERSQLSLLIRHFLERFLNNESVSASGDAKARLIQIACVIGLPPIIVAMYLWSAYHRMDGRMPSYWSQVGHHFFFVMYALVAAGIVMVYEWDLFFPDLLDVFVLSTLPVAQRRLFMARIAAIGLFVMGFLFDANAIAPLALLAATDPPDAARFFAAHFLAVGSAGIFSAALVLGLQAVLLALIGETFFRRVAPFLQAGAVIALLILLFLLPAISVVLDGVLRPDNPYAFYFPPFWFLGMYQRVMEGASALPVYSRLAEIGCIATVSAVVVTCLFYPIAYWRRTNELVVGQRISHAHKQRVGILQRILHATVLKTTVRRAVFHFTSQTLLRLQRYRIYLVLCGGVAISLAVAMLVRFSIHKGHVHTSLSPDGMYAAIPILAFWAVAALRMAFLSPGNERGSWIFRTILGKPPLDALRAAKLWVLLCTLCVAMAGAAILYFASPSNLPDLSAAVGHCVVFAGLCVLLADIFFLSVRVIPFTRTEAAEKTNVAITFMKYIAFFPLFVFVPVSLIPWMDEGIAHTTVVVGGIIIVHFMLERSHRNAVKEHLVLPDLDDEDEGMILTLGLRR